MGATQEALESAREAARLDKIKPPAWMWGRGDSVELLAAWSAEVREDGDRKLDRVLDCKQRELNHAAKDIDAMLHPLGFGDMVEVVERVRIGLDGKPDESTRSIEVLGPATSADLLELDAVPEPVDSDAPRDIHARTLARGSVQP